MPTKHKIPEDDEEYFHEALWLVDATAFMLKDIQALVAYNGPHLDQNDRWRQAHCDLYQNVMSMYAHLPIWMKDGGDESEPRASYAPPWKPNFKVLNAGFAEGEIEPASEGTAEG